MNEKDTGRRSVYLQGWDKCHGCGHPKDKLWKVGNTRLCESCGEHLDIVMSLVDGQLVGRLILKEAIVETQES